MSTMADFLLARIAEDQEMWELAQQAGMTFVVKGGTSLPPEDFIAQYIDECKAKRRIVEIAESALRVWERNMATTRELSMYYARMNDAAHTLQALALPYAGHPDYQEEWGLSSEQLWEQGQRPGRLTDAEERRIAELVVKRIKREDRSRAWEPLL
jgi:Family of unknown function (DUF6221)